MRIISAIIFGARPLNLYARLRSAGQIVLAVILIEKYFPQTPPKGFDTRLTEREARWELYLISAPAAYICRCVNFN